MKAIATISIWLEACYRARHQESSDRLYSRHAGSSFPLAEPRQQCRLRVATKSNQPGNQPTPYGDLPSGFLNGRMLGKPVSGI
jgi:hypothetical protein